MFVNPDNTKMMKTQWQHSNVHRISVKMYFVKNKVWDLVAQKLERPANSKSIHIRATRTRTRAQMSTHSDTHGANACTHNDKDKDTHTNKQRNAHLRTHIHTQTNTHTNTHTETYIFTLKSTLLACSEIWYRYCFSYTYTLSDKLQAVWCSHWHCKHASKVIVFEPLLTQIQLQAAILHLLLLF